MRFFRNLGNIVMDLDDVERIDLNALAGADNVVLNDMSGTDLDAMDTDLSNPADSGTPDADDDTVTVNATEGDDIVVAAAAGGVLRVEGLATALSVTGASAANDRLFVNTLGGADVVDASGVEAPRHRRHGQHGRRRRRGHRRRWRRRCCAAATTTTCCIGGPGTDTLDGGAGDNVLIDGENIVAGRVEGDEWLETHTRVEGGRTVLDTGERSYAIPAADLT